MTRQIKKDPRLARLSQLSGLFEATFQAAQAAHIAARTEVDALEQNIAELRQRHKQLGHTTRIDPADFLSAGRHKAWIVQQIKALNLELARALVVEHECREALAVENGRKQVLRKLAE